MVRNYRHDLVWRGIRLTCYYSLLTSSYNGFDGSLINSLQSMDTWEDYFNRPQGGLLGLLNAIQVRTGYHLGTRSLTLGIFTECIDFQNIGSIAAFPFAPYLSDGIGRRHTIIMGAAIVLVGAALQTAAHSIGMFIGARCVIDSPTDTMNSDEHLPLSGL